jgi:hypothetical protein
LWLVGSATCWRVVLEIWDEEMWKCGNVMVDSTGRMG